MANSIARLIVAAPHRDGGQAQFVDSPVGRTDGSLSAVTGLGDRPPARADHRTGPGGQACVSERTLTRRWFEETGMPPLQWLLRARVQLARELIEAGELSIETVAERCGLGTAANLRLHFRRLVGTSPTSYRRAFAR